MTFVSTSSFSSKSYEQKYSSYERSPFASVSMSALNYQATNRIQSLAKPKIRFSRYISNPTYCGVSKAAVHESISRNTLEYQSTERINQLALPKKLLDVR